MTKLHSETLSLKPKEKIVRFRSAFQWFWDGHEHYSSASQLDRGVRTEAGPQGTLKG